ncbi:MAG: hypothetical protein A2Z37_00245 [Chloroflexi bacterium RBG_19FT_COMBO_62_14]|nr:MAG: hypothetical protein A2Z37_00245 [Chloroflexi bacterium RBG_19FT_COMBO_62_14]
MDLGQQIAIYLGVFLLLWYIAAAAYNRRRGVRAYRWLRPGLAKLGPISDARWIGSSGSGARLVVGKADRPFRQVEAAYLLETRELLPLWLINRLRGRRDALILRADLRSSPRGELEVMRRGDSRLKGITASGERNPWILSKVEFAGEFQSAQRGRVPEPLLEEVRIFLETAGACVRRMSFSLKSPHIILEADLVGLMESPAESFFATMQRAFGGGTSAEQA